MTQSTFKFIRIGCLISAALIFLFPLKVFAYCSEPSMYESPPDIPGSYQRPSLPYCLESYSYSRKHTCDQWEIDAYIDETNDYIRKLNTFVDEAQAFANAAAIFTDEAAAYASCEAKDVKSEIE